MGWILGLDLGQTADYTAITVLEQTVGAEPKPHYAVVHLERPPLGTPYPAIVARIREMLLTPALAGAPVIADATGVGAGVIDLFRLLRTPVTAVWITAGSHVTREGAGRVNVPKRELVAVLAVLFQTGRLKVAEQLPLAPTLVKELLGFKVKIDPLTANDSYGCWREGQHDDLVLSVAMAAWYGERGMPFVPFSAVGRPRRNDGVSDPFTEYLAQPRDLSMEIMRQGGKW